MLPDANRPMDYCRHCKQPRRLHRRKLCFACYYTPGVRTKYGPASPRGNKARNNDAGENIAIALPHLPTDAMPGTEAKIIVMSERERFQLAVCHPLDAQDEEPRKVADARARLIEHAWRTWHCCLFGAATGGDCDCKKKARPRAKARLRPRPKRRPPEDGPAALPTTHLDTIESLGTFMYAEISVA